MSHQIVITDEQLNEAVDKLWTDAYWEPEDGFARPDIYLALVDWLNDAVARLLVDINEWTQGLRPFPTDFHLRDHVWRHRDERIFKEKLAEASI